MRDHYRIIDDPLGKGAYGEVRKCYTIPFENMRNKSTCKQFRAVKVLSKSYMDDKAQLCFLTEVNIMKILNHHSIAKAIHYFEDTKRFMLITELCTGGEVFDLVMKDGKLSQDKAACIVRQVLSAIKYMHNEGGVNECIPGDCEIIHRDLKLENILLSQESSGDPYPEIRLIDFGTARNLKKDYQHHELIGTPNYMAPEVLHSNKNAKPPRYYGSKCDMWSMGVICYALLCGRLPLDVDHNLQPKKQDQDLLNRIVNFKADNECFSHRAFTELDADPRDFLQKLLVADPEKRFSAAQAMDHKWIEGFWDQMLASLQADIEKHKNNLGESPTIKCLKSLREFRKTLHEEDDEKVLFRI